MAFPQGINFRDTVAYTTDGPDESAEVGSGGGTTLSTYPRTTAQGNTVGWEGITAGAPVQTRNRRFSNPAPLAGIHHSGSAGTFHNYRIDLPVAGSYNIRVAAGDPDIGWWSRLEVLDNAASLGVLFDAQTPSANTFFDAAGNVHAAADWPANNVAVAKTFATTICRFRHGRSATNSNLAHIHIESAGGSTPENIPMTPGTFAFTGRTFNLNAREHVAMTPVSFNFTGGNFEALESSAVQMIAAAFNFVARIFTVNAPEVVDMIAAAFNFTAGNFVVLQDDTVAMTPGQFKFAAPDFTLLEVNNVRMTPGQFNFRGRFFNVESGDPDPKSPTTWMLGPRGEQVYSRRNQQGGWPGLWRKQ